MQNSCRPLRLRRRKRSALKQPALVSAISVSQESKAYRHPCGGWGLKMNDEETVNQLAFNIQWYYALNITEESDAAKFVKKKKGPFT